MALFYIFISTIRAPKCTLVIGHSHTNKKKMNPIERISCKRDKVCLLNILVKRRALFINLLVNLVNIDSRIYGWKQLKECLFHHNSILIK
jgi:hypothetical protein